MSVPKLKISGISGIKSLNPKNDFNERIRFKELHRKSQMPKPSQKKGKYHQRITENVNFWFTQNRGPSNVNSQVHVIPLTYKYVDTFLTPSFIEHRLSMIMSPMGILIFVDKICISIVSSSRLGTSFQLTDNLGNHRTRKFLLRIPSCIFPMRSS